MRIIGVSSVIFALILGACTGGPGASQTATEPAPPITPQAIAPAPAGVDAEKQRRGALEETAAAQPAPRSTARVRVPEEDKTAAAQKLVPALRDQLSRAHDWRAQLLAGGRVVDDLRLSLSAPGEAYGYGPPYYVYVGLENHADRRRSLDALPACGALGRADSLVFHVRSSSGAELTVVNRFSDTDANHAHAPLIVDPRTALEDLVDFNELVASSGDLLRLVQQSTALTLTAEAPTLLLTSNPVAIGVKK